MVLLTKPVRMMVLLLRSDHPFQSYLRLNFCFLNNSIGDGRNRLLFKYPYDPRVQKPYTNFERERSLLKKFWFIVVQRIYITHHYD
jgi:hypothetical protein